MNQRNVSLNLIIKHFENQAWFQNDLAAFQAERDRRTEIASRMSLRENEWTGEAPSMQRKIKARIREEIEAEVA